MDIDRDAFRELVQAVRYPLNLRDFALLEVASRAEEAGDAERAAELRAEADEVTRKWEAIERLT